MHLNTIRYNSMFNQWESMAPMPEAVLYPAVAATKQRIYVFGGEDTTQNPVRIIQVGHYYLQTLNVSFRTHLWHHHTVYFHSPLPLLSFCRCIISLGICGLSWRTEQ